MNPNQSQSQRETDDAMTMEVLPASAIGVLERASIDTQVATAHAYPRSIDRFKKQALAFATLDEETAEQCIYLRPVGMKINPKTGKREQEYAEGPSIRLAEIVAASYGNIRVSAQIVEQTERYVKCEGIAFDLENNYAAKSQSMASTVKKTGEPFSEGMRAVVALATQAKAFRDAVFKVVPRALCKPIMEAAKKVANGEGKPLEQRRQKVQAWLSSKKIEQERVFAALGVTEWSQVLDEHLIKLTGLKTAIGEGIPIDEAFPPVEAADKKPEPTGLQQATGTKAKEPLKTEKKPEPPKPAEPAKAEPAPEGGSTPAQTGNAAPTPASEQPKAQESTPEPSKSSPPEDAKAEADAGLAPAAPAVAPESTIGKPFTPDPKESLPLQTVRQLGHNSGVNETQIIGWAKANRLAKDNQKLADLSGSKLEQMIEKWPNILPGIQKEPPF